MVSFDPQSPKGERARDWLRYIRNSKDGLSWLAPYEDHLIALTRKGIYTPREFKDTAHLLMEIVPYFVLTLSHADNWVPILLSALLQAQDLKHGDLQVQIFNALGETYIKSDKHKPAYVSFEKALQRAEESQTHTEMVTSYTGLFKLQWFDLAHPITPHLVKHSLDIAQQIADLELKANL